MVERIVQHRHCKECGKVVVREEEFCDDDCETTYKTRLRRKARQLLWIYVGSIVAIVLLTALAFLR